MKNVEDNYFYKPLKIDGWEFWDVNNKAFPEYFDITFDMIKFYAN